MPSPSGPIRQPTGSSCLPICCRRRHRSTSFILWTLDEQTGDRPQDALMGIDALLHLTHALEETMPVAKLRLDLVTRGAQPAGRDMGATAVAQAPAIGIFRVMLGEHPNLACRGIDLAPSAASSDRDFLWHELTGTGHRTGNRPARGSPLCPAAHPRAARPRTNPRGQRAPASRVPGTRSAG